MKHCWLAIALLAASAESQSLWSVVATGVAPSPRYNHSTAYDQVTQRLVVFGGIGLPSDTWEFNGATWMQRQPTTTPPVRLAAAMAHLPGTIGVFLFGGTTGSDPAAMDDTWHWDGANWTQMSPSNSPSRRLAHAMATDWVHGRVVLHGGRDFTGIHQADTWAWDGANWTQLASTGPAPRCCHDMVQDAGRDRIVLFGGWNGSTLGDTWEFDGATWQSVNSTTVPTTRWGHRMAYDFVNNVTIMHGGIATAAETWSWNGSDWTLLGVDPAAQRYNLELDWVWATGRVTMFGGYDGSSANPTLGDTRTLGVAAPASVLPFGTGCAGTAGTPTLQTQGGALPWIGRTFTLALSPVSTFAFLVFGWSTTMSGPFTLPFSLGPQGAPGCDVLVSSNAVLGIAGTGSVTTPIAIPFVPSLVGLSFHNQGAVLDPGANALGLVLSNATTAIIGWQ